MRRFIICDTNVITNPKNTLRHTVFDCPVLYKMMVTSINNGRMNTNKDFRCFLSETSKLVVVPFLDLTYNQINRGTKIHPTIRNVTNAAFLTSSVANIVIVTNRGMVNNG